MMKNKMIHEQNWNKLEEYLRECADRGIFGGADFALVRPDEIRIARVGCRQCVPTREINDAHTLWDLASISKVLVTVTCILKLKEEGLISLNTRIADILPDFCQKEMTVKDCITHTSGLSADIEGYKQMSAEEMLEAVRNVKCTYQPKTKVLYSDINFILLGQVIAKLKGSLDGYAEKVIFEPLKMTHTCYNPPACKKDLCAAYEDIPERGGIVRGVVHDGKAFKLGGVSGHAGVFSTIEDLTHFVKMLLNDGVYEGKTFFDETTMELLKTCQTVNLNEKRSIGWVLSDPHYALGDNYSEHTLFHTGFSGSCMVIDLDRKAGFITCCNRIHPSRLNTRLLTERNIIHNLAYQCI